MAPRGFIVPSRGGHPPQFEVRFGVQRIDARGFAELLTRLGLPVQTQEVSAGLNPVLRVARISAPAGSSCTAAANLAVASLLRPVAYAASPRPTTQRTSSGTRRTTFSASWYLSRSS